MIRIRCSTNYKVSDLSEILTSNCILWTLYTFSYTLSWQQTNQDDTTRRILSKWNEYIGQFTQLFVLYTFTMSKYDIELVLMERSEKRWIGQSIIALMIQYLNRIPTNMICGSEFEKLRTRITQVSNPPHCQDFKTLKYILWNRSLHFKGWDSSSFT